MCCDIGYYFDSTVISIKKCCAIINVIHTLQGLNKSSARKAVVTGIQGIQTELQESWKVTYPELDDKEKPYLLASQFSFERLHEVRVTDLQFCVETFYIEAIVPF